MIDIFIKNPSKKEKGITKLEANGKAIEGNFIPVEMLMEKNKVVAVM
ncbi:hypothetical protein ES705_30254 [subsurface metagenome]